MTAEHVAASTPKGRELVEVVASFLRDWVDLKYPANRFDAERMAILDMIEEVDDHLIISIGVTLATWGEGAP